MRPWLITPAERRLVLLLFALTVAGLVGKTTRGLDPRVAAWIAGEAGPPAPPPAAADSSRAPEVPGGGAAPAGPGRTPAAADDPGEGVDPNQADVEELTTLPGIGPALAARIVADRAARGPYRAPEDLLRVPGIGPATLARIRDRLRFGSGPGG